MKKNMMLLGLIFSTCLAFEVKAADQKILDCNTAMGPDQQVTVLMTSEGKLLLKELTTSGGLKTRDLSSEEFESADIKLRTDKYGSVSRLFKEDGRWVVSSKSFGYEQFGSADCFIDEM